MIFRIITEEGIYICKQTLFIMHRQIKRVLVIILSQILTSNKSTELLKPHKHKMHEQHCYISNTHQIFYLPVWGLGSIIQCIGMLLQRWLHYKAWKIDKDLFLSYFSICIMLYPMRSRELNNLYDHDTSNNLDEEDPSYQKYPVIQKGHDKIQRAIYIEELSLKNSDTFV